MKNTWNVENADWFNNPIALGHTWAKDTVKLAQSLFNKFKKDKSKQLLFKKLVQTDSQEWHYWSQLTKKYLASISYVLRRIGKVPYLDLLYWLYHQEGLLKSQLTWYLEIKCYQKETKEYLKSYSKDFGSLGLSKKDAQERFNNYHLKLISKNPTLVE